MHDEDEWMLCSGASGSDLEKPSGHKKKKQRTEADASSAADFANAQKVVKGILKLKVAAPFSTPVSEEDVPGYGAVIDNPMDLGTVLEKLKKGEYASAGQTCAASTSNGMSCVWSCTVTHQLYMCLLGKSCQNWLLGALFKTTCLDVHVAHA